MFKEFIKGLSITFKHMLPGNSTTVQYPKQKLEISDRFRGLHRLVPAHDGYTHAEGNSDAHIKTLVTVICQRLK